MDFGTILGLLAGFACIVAGIIWARGNPFQFIHPSSAMITIGCTTATVFIGNTMSAAMNTLNVAKNAFFQSPMRPDEIILTLVSFSEKARREGLLALEDDLEELDNVFMKKGIQLVVDGTDPELVKNIMLTDLNYIENRHEAAKQMFDDMGSLAPAFGMIGTLIGLILMLRNIEDKSALGPGMSTALITTFYGALLANLVFIPVANKLRTRNNAEVLLKEIIIEGTLSIQSGDNPRIVKDKLVSFLSPSVRQQVSEEVGE